MGTDAQTRYHFLVDKESRESVERFAAQMRDDCTIFHARTLAHQAEDVERQNGWPWWSDERGPCAVGSRDGGHRTAIPRPSLQMTFVDAGQAKLRSSADG